MKPTPSPLDAAIRAAMAKRQPRQRGGYLIHPLARERVLALYSAGLLRIPERF